MDYEKISLTKIVETGAGLQGYTLFLSEFLKDEPDWKNAADLFVKIDAGDHSLTGLPFLPVVAGIVVDKLLEQSGKNKEMTGKFLSLVQPGKHWIDTAFLKASVCAAMVINESSEKLSSQYFYNFYNLDRYRQWLDSSKADPTAKLQLIRLMMTHDRSQPVLPGGPTDE